MDKNNLALHGIVTTANQLIVEWCAY